MYVCMYVSLPSSPSRCIYKCSQKLQTKTSVSSIDSWCHAEPCMYACKYAMMDTLAAGIGKRGSCCCWKRYEKFCRYNILFYFHFW